MASVVVATGSAALAMNFAYRLQNMHNPREYVDAIARSQDLRIVFKSTLSVTLIQVRK